MLKVTSRVTYEVARKLIENAVKGNPQFKPHKGEHGGCSWFHVSGDAYSGIDFSFKNVVVTAYIDECHVVPDDELVLRKIEEIKIQDPWLIDSSPKRFDAIVWNAIGAECATRAQATKLYVPKCKLSMRDGEFLVVPTYAAEHLNIDLEKLAADNNVSVFDEKDFSVDAYLTERTEYEKNKDVNLSKIITIWLGPFGNDDGVAFPKMRELEKKINENHVVVDVKKNFRFATVKFINSTWKGFDEVSGRFGVVSLKYHNYRDARNAYKRLLAATQDEQKIHCFPGENWKKRTVFSEGQTRTGKTEQEVLKVKYELY